MNGVKMRKLNREEVIELANTPGVKRIAVENFLLTVHNNPDFVCANLNLEQDAASYGWNLITLNTIRKGIRLANR